MLAGLVQLVLVEDNVEHLRRTLRQLLGRHQLDVDVPGLRLGNLTYRTDKYKWFTLSLLADYSKRIEENL